MKKYPLICSDIDGTLLNKERELSNLTIRTIYDLDKAGYYFVMISARMPKAMRPFQAQIGINSPIVCFNGAFIESEVKESGKTDVLENSPIEIEHFMQILDILDRHPKVHISTFYINQWYSNKMDKWTEREINNTKNYPDILSEQEIRLRFSRAGHGAHKLLIMGEAEDIENLFQEFNTSNFENFIDIYRSKDTYLEINAKRVSKLKSVKTLCKYYGLNLKDVLAFGDNYNDIEMLSKVGCGVAVKNARPEVKNAAKYETLENIFDGVAVYLKKNYDI